MAQNAHWNVEGRAKDTGNYVGVYLLSPDLANSKEARKRAATKAKAKWAKQGIKATVTCVRCVG